MSKANTATKCNDAMQLNEESAIALYTVNLAEKVSTLDPVIGRDKEINKIVEILSRKNKNNPILLGEPGVGKTAVVEGLVQKINEGDIPLNLRGKEVISLDLGSLLSGTAFRGEFEKRLKKLLNEIDKEKYILFIDEIHTLVGAGKTEGSLDAVNLMKPMLARGELRCIGATTLDEYKQSFEKDGALERRFQKILVEEPSEEDTLNILKGLKSRYETHHQIKISDEALESSVKLSKRYLTDRYLPDKAFDLLDEACSKVSIQANKIKSVYAQMEKYQQENNWEKLAELKHGILPGLEKEDSEGLVKVSNLQEVISDKTKIPLTNIQESERDKLLKIEDFLRERVIGQDHALKKLAETIRIARVDLGNPERPNGSFLFLGTTGVGKTETAKTLAEFLFNSEESIIRLDMSEYMEKHSVSKLIGAPAGYIGYEEGGQLTESVKHKPYSVILFDEIEKAHPDVLNLLLQMLDDGRLTDSKGRTVSFSNTIIIMTSNLKKEDLKKSLRPEFINRIDEIITFSKLSKEDIEKITRFHLEKLKIKVKENHNINLIIKEDLISFIVESSFDNEFGARPLRRVIQKTIQVPLSEKILKGDYEENATIILEKDL